MQQGKWGKSKRFDKEINKSITKTAINCSPLYKNHNIRGSDTISQWWEVEGTVVE